MLAIKTQFIRDERGFVIANLIKLAGDYSLVVELHPRFLSIVPDSIPSFKAVLGVSQEVESGQSSSQLHV